jgi:phospholipid/cholesterol/gamma-HCH transport system substrate-binding protein
MQKNLVETILGAVVLVVAGGFLAFFYKTTDIHPSSGYVITASFSQIDGLDTGMPVKISGVKVGQVLDFAINPQNYTAIVRMNINDDVKLPSDTVADIVSAGLLDGRYVSLLPGGEETVLKPGAQISGQYSPGLEQVIGKAIYGLTESSKNSTKPGNKNGAPAGADHP